MRQYKKYIRMDDYPHGKPIYNSNYKKIVSDWVRIFEDSGVNYILGVSPLLLKRDDIDFLSDIIINGKIVMHGFNHKFDHLGNWNTIVNTWEFGGEFMNMDEKKIFEKYELSDLLLSNFKTYDPEHFIPPFNCITQELINVLSVKKVKYIHTCDKEFYEYKYSNIDFKNIDVVISNYHKGYDHAHEVLKRLNTDIGQITLHWIFDSEFPNWLETYRDLVSNLKNDINFIS